MRVVQKRREPQTLTDTRNASTTDLSRPQPARAAFDQLDKDAVRACLLEEQNSLCAFCMRRIRNNNYAVDEHGQPTMKIAHRVPIQVDPTQALSWRNLLGSCDGGQRSRGRYRTCDAAQGAQALSIDPTTSMVARLQYVREEDPENGRSLRGLRITSQDPALKHDVRKTLSLNEGDLPELREKAWDAFVESYRRAHPRGPFGKAAYRTYLPKWLSQHGVDYPEMLGVIEYKIR